VPEWPDDFTQVIRARCRLLSASSELPPDASLTSLGVDSLEMVELIVGLEDTFDIEIPQQLLTPEVFATPGTIWAALGDHIAQAGRVGA
jgi:acyl carrier protein